MSNKKFIELKNIRYNIMMSCQLCPRKCKVDRISGEIGFCGVPLHSKICKELTHYAEEPELVPTYSLYFSGCNMRCSSCSNAFMLDNDKITQPFIGCEELAKRIDNKVISKAVKSLFLLGGEATCNLYDIVDTISYMKTKPLIVWNSNMYYSEEAFAVIKEFADVFLADIKFGCNECAEKISRTPFYLGTVINNIENVIKLNKKVVIRHLALSGHFDCCTKPILELVAKSFPNQQVGIISLIPNGLNDIKAPSHEEINRIEKLIEKLELKKITYDINSSLTESNEGAKTKTMESILHIRKDGTILIQDVTKEIIRIIDFSNKCE